MIERDQRTTHTVSRLRSCANADPVHLASDSFCNGLTADPANSDNSIEGQPSYSAHAVLIAENPACIRVSFVRSFIDQRSAISIAGFSQFEILPLPWSLYL
jgi:hypothetical protein